MCHRTDDSSSARCLPAVPKRRVNCSTLSTDFSTTSVLLWVVLLIHTAQAYDVLTCVKSALGTSDCNPQRNTRSADVQLTTKEINDSVNIAVNYIVRYETAFRCIGTFNAEEVLNTTVASNASNYLKTINRTNNIKKAFMLLGDLGEYIKEVEAKTRDKYYQMILCDMASRIQATRLITSSANLPNNYTRLKDEFKVNDSETEENRQRKVIFTIFAQLYTRLGKLINGTVKKEHRRTNIKRVDIEAEKLSAIYKQKYHNITPQRKKKITRNYCNLLEEMYAVRQMLQGKVSTEKINNKMNKVKQIIGSVRRFTKSYKGGCKKIQDKTQKRQKNGCRKKYCCESDTVIPCLLGKYQELNNKLYCELAKTPGQSVKSIKRFKC